MAERFKIIAGPCLAESEEIVIKVAQQLAECSRLYPTVDFYFKASFRKANRTSDGSFEGCGDELALSWIANAGKQFSLKTLTDIHSPSDAAMAAEFVDVLQIPAFLSRQTDLLKAAGNTGKIVNIKKGQFLAPDDAIKAAKKIESTNNSNIWLTERGTFFGYHDLVVDFRSMIIMKQSGYPIIYDATHSVQQPSIGTQSGGRPEFIKDLTRAAVAIGIDGMFFETHPDPKNAKSDAATQLPLSELFNFVAMIINLNNFINK